MALRSVSRKGAEATATPPTITVWLKANAVIFQGELVATDATGYAISGTGIGATGLTIWGVASKSQSNVGGTDGLVSVDVIRGIYPFLNHGADALTQADVGKTCFAEDYQTVRKTSATSTRSNAGLFIGFDENSQPLVQVGNLSQTGV